MCNKRFDSDSLRRRLHAASARHSSYLLEPPMPQTHSSRLVALFMFVLSSAAWADCGPKDPDICAASSPWYAANYVKLAVSQPNTADMARFTLTVPDPLNLVLDLDSLSEGKPQKGSIKLVEGRAMLTRGLTLKRGYEIDALDGPILTYQILVSLLSQAIPNGSDRFTGDNTINIKEKKRGIRIATTSASGYFPPPWRLAGSVSRKDKETVDFSLQFTYTHNKATAVLLLDGTWRQLQQAPKIDSSMSLSGWKLHLLGPVEIKQEGSTILDYAAQSKPTPLGTLGELRKSILAVKAGSNPALQGTPATGRP